MVGSTTRSLWFVAVAMSLGLSLQIYDGLYDPWAVALLLITLMLFSIGAFASAKPIATRTLAASLLIANFVQLAAGFFRDAGATHSYMPPGSQGPYHAGLLAAALGLITVSLRPRLTPLAAIYLLAIFAVVGIWKIRSVPRPNIDVYVFQTDAPVAFMSGINPYTITFANIYGPDTTVYGPGIVRDGRLQFGYPYPPLCLYWATPAARLLGDFRYAQLFALLLAGGVICWSAGGSIGVMTAALLLFSPRTFYVIESGWTEPLSILLLTLFAHSRFRSSRWTLLWFGLFIASKQYLPVTLLLLPILCKAPRELAKAFAIVCGIALFVSAPLVFWNFTAFLHSAVTLQLHQPFRDDALSLLNPWARNLAHRDALAALAFLLAAGWAIVAYWSEMRFIRALAGQVLLLFAFNKQAFANYYELTIAALLLSVVEDFVQSRVTSADTELSDYARTRPAHSLDPAGGTAGSAG